MWQSYWISLSIIWDIGDTVSHSEAIAKARGSIAGMARLVAYGAVCRIIGCLGDPQASRLDRTVMSAGGELESPIGTLTMFGMELDVSAGFPHTSLERTHREVEDNAVCRDVLQRLVVRHMHLFPMRFDERQRACAELGIRYREARIRSLDLRRKLIAPSDAGRR